MKNKLIELLKGASFNAADYCSKTDCRDCNESIEFGGGCLWALEADHLIDNGVTIQRWIPANEPPKKYRDEYGELISFLVCEYGTEEPFRAFYDGREWGDGYFEITVTHWMPLPEPPKEEE